MAFSASANPHNILTEAINDKFVHIEENYIEYYEALKENGGTQ